MTTRTATAENSTILSISARRIIPDRQRLRTIFLRCSQFVTWPVAWVFFNLLYRIDIRGQENLSRVRSPLIIVANHANVTDSFLFRLILGFSTPHLPLRFMGVRRFRMGWLNFLTEIGFIDFIYSLFGVFTVVPGRGLAKNLEESKRIINSRGNIVIYPEGDLETDNQIAPFRSGASVLARDTGAPVVPVSFRVGHRKWLRRSMCVSVGEPFRIPAGMNTDEATKVLFDKVVGLYEGR